MRYELKTEPSGHVGSGVALNKMDEIDSKVRGVLTGFYVGGFLPQLSLLWFLVF